MDGEQALLHAAVFAASLLQAAAGIGFGIIAGPIILVVMNSGAAIQVSILLSFAIALVLAPAVVRQADRPLLAQFTLGTLIGAPFGIAAFQAAGIAALKAMAAIAVLFMAVSAAGWLNRRGAPAPRDSRLRNGLVGAISGAMSTALAMPGPAIAAELAAQGRDKTVLRATVLSFFLISYPLAFVVQYSAVGISGAALELSLELLPATALGVLAGRLLVPHVSETLFRRIIVAVLLATAAGLVASL